ncbi:hypothetical protein [Streptococcus suis]|uniref:hypothetical protein n=1 Tax=Streptococcus suis TaxID=1307 RepID=UPI001EE73AE4|nr:hypothetical protein [Streptococcus suis]
MSKKQTYKEFKKWVDDQVNMAEAMGLDENAEVLPDMVEQNAQAWVQIQEMLEEHTLHYRAKGKKRKKARKNYTISRKKYLDLLKQLYELYDLAEKVEDFQPLILKEADKKEFCELWVGLQEGLGYLLSEYNSTLTEKELEYIEGETEDD